MHIQICIFCRRSSFLTTAMPWGVTDLCTMAVFCSAFSSIFSRCRLLKVACCAERMSATARVTQARERASEKELCQHTYTLLSLLPCHASAIPSPCISQLLCRFCILLCLAASRSFHDYCSSCYCIDRDQTWYLAHVGMELFSS